MRLFLKAVLLVASFIATYFLLLQVNWVKVLHIKEVGESTEEKLGALYWSLYSKMEDEIHDQEILAPIDSLVHRICQKNDLDKKKIKVHLMHVDQVNAFALPDHHLVLFSDLVLDCEHENELSGVIAHEIAHMESGHIMKKLVKEIGLSMLISMTAGNGNPETIHRAIKILSSTAYDRSLESEADAVGVQYLINAGIDPEGLANFLFRMGAAEKDAPTQLSWISTHPLSEERSKAIIEQKAGKTFENVVVLDSIHWSNLKELIRKN